MKYGASGHNTGYERCFLNRVHEPWRGKPNGHRTGKNDEYSWNPSTSLTIHDFMTVDQPAICTETGGLAR